MSARTTLTLDDDLLQRLKRESVLRGETFKGYLNDVIRRGLEPPNVFDGVAETLPTYQLGTRVGVDLTKALALAAELDDEPLLAASAISTGGAKLAVKSIKPKTVKSASIKPNGVKPARKSTRA